MLHEGAIEARIQPAPLSDGVVIVRSHVETGHQRGARVDGGLQDVPAARHSGTVQRARLRVTHDLAAEGWVPGVQAPVEQRGARYARDLVCYRDVIVVEGRGEVGQELRRERRAERPGHGDFGTQGGVASGDLAALAGGALEADVHGGVLRLRHAGA